MREDLKFFGFLCGFIGLLFLVLYFFGVVPRREFEARCKAGGGMVWARKGADACLLPPYNRLEID